MRKRFFSSCRWLSLLSVLTLFWLLPATIALAAQCPTYFLKTAEGEIINPMTGENAREPYSTRQTCGSCHDYDRISRGYHFQMGWDELSENEEKPWALSPGMMGGY